MSRIVAYEPVSTARQGASGLGIEAQRQAIEAYAAHRGATILARFTEVETRAQPGPAGTGQGAASGQGHRCDAGHRQARPTVAERRLPADAADSGVRFVAVDLPEANDLTVGIMALVAQAEREAIPRRTREALAVAKMRGVKLGNPNGAAALRRSGQGGAPLPAAISRNADRHVRDLGPVLADIRATSAASLRAIATELNARGMLTRRGGRWHVSTVRNLLARLDTR